MNASEIEVAKLIAITNGGEGREDLRGGVLNIAFGERARATGKGARRRVRFPQGGGNNIRRIRRHSAHRRILLRSLASAFVRADIADVVRAKTR